MDKDSLITLRNAIVTVMATKKFREESYKELNHWLKETNQKLNQIE